MKTFYPTIVLFVTVSLLSCTQKREISVPKKYKKLVDVYVELYLLKNQTVSNDSAYADSVQLVLHKFDFTQDEYRKALAYFNDKPERWELFYKEVSDKLQEKVPPNVNTSNQSSKIKSVAH